MQESEIIARDIAAEKYEQLELKGKGYHHIRIQLNVILSNVKIKANDYVLDAGCGTGRITRPIAQRCGKVIAIDFSENSIKVLKEISESKSIKNIEIMRGDLTKDIPLENIDKAISVQVIQHIPSEISRIESVKNICNCLKDGGTFTMASYNYNIFMKNHGVLKEGFFPNGIYYIRYTPEEIKILFQKCGFEDIIVRGYNNFCWYYILGNSKFANLILYPVAIIDELISRFKFSAKTGQYLICTGVKRSDSK
jgi:cyclopropane fatty-acyl-phospholipid synthase-like methyltransferase